MPTDADPICVRCNQPVRVTREYYSVQEKMHWICFHLEFEHYPYDPDEPCADPSCPRLQVEVFARKLREMGYDPGQLAIEAAQEHSVSRGNAT